MKTKAVFEVIGIFGLTMLLIALVGLSPIGYWERQITNRYFAEYAVMIVVPVIWLVITRRNLASYGLSLRNLLYHLDVAATSFVPVAIASATLAFVDYKHWSGAIVLAGVKIAVLFAVGWLLKRKPTWNGRDFLAGAAILLPCLNLTLRVTLDNAVSAFIFYVFFLGFGEELDNVS
jgi:hypothetical protein